MIVKNESKTIVRCLESCKNIIDDWIITDTGSKDKTVDLIERYFKKNNWKS